MKACQTALKLNSFKAHAAGVRQRGDVDSEWKVNIMTAVIAKSPHKINQEIITTLRRITNQRTTQEEMRCSTFGKSNNPQ